MEEKMITIIEKSLVHFKDLPGSDTPMGAKAYAMIIYGQLKKFIDDHVEEIYYGN